MTRRSCTSCTGLTLDNIHCTVGTGYGRVNVPFADKALTEIACHARGGNFMYGSSVRTILDMGGQDCKAIDCDERGKVEAFLMNDKRAVASGRAAAEIIDRYLGGDDRVSVQRAERAAPDPWIGRADGFVSCPRVPIPCGDPAQRRTDFRPIEGGYTPDEAMTNWTTSSSAALGSAGVLSAPATPRRAGRPRSPSGL